MLVPWPLTGVPAEAPPERPALAVKIENSTAARPQTGLNSADMVWEQVVEGGITRFVAVFHSSPPPEIGPIRSVRPMDAAIAGPLRGLFAFSGGGPDFVRAIADTGMQVLSQDAGAAGFFRSSNRSAPHNVYADPAALLAQADAAHLAAPPAQFQFVPVGSPPTAFVQGAPTASLQLKLSGTGRPTWTWGPAEAAWLRSEGTTPATEADGARVRTNNVVVLRVDVVNTPYRDPAGNPVPETRMVGSGEALVASAGSTIAATWTKASETAPVVLTGPDGLPVQLAPGNTWVELVPRATGSVTLG
ncbi:DUF3048 domain-containing protein [Candidatus Blastococcus massiliensis]|uniref:DUF3048 domain-containing protein n=1 Tax=Candidatus Blastococcus massiliensis TaxID=1470358 RepID=UPI0004B67C53|nr:DUF3048 domain-containing protein [Candidatus Blastococcus massiliensis]